MNKMVDSTQTDNDALSKLNYKPELKRTLKLFGTFAASFSAISITTGIYLNYPFILKTIGPLGIWTFPIVGIGSTIIALIFSEICQFVPTTGHCYVWISKLCNPGLGWFVGWLTFAYMIVILPSVDTALGPVIGSLLGITVNDQTTAIIAIIAVSLQLLINIFSVKISSMVNNAAVITESCGILILTVVLTIFAFKNNQPVSNIFAVSPALKGQSLFLPFLMSSLMGFYTLVAFETAANLSDETFNSKKTIPKAMLFAIIGSTILGTLFAAVINWNIKDMSAVINSDAALPLIISTSLGTVVSKLFFVVASVAIFGGGLVFMTSASRTVYAMSRDNAFFASSLFKRVSKKTFTPIPACILFWVISTLFLIFTSPTTLSVASAAMPSIYYLITIVAYASVRKKQKFLEGDFNLKKAGNPLIIVSIIWLVISLIILTLPAEFRSGIVIDGGMFALGIVIYFVYFRRKLDVSNETQVKVHNELADVTPSLTED